MREKEILEHFLIYLHGKNQIDSCTIVYLIKAMEVARDPQTVGSKLHVFTFTLPFIA